MNLLWTFSDRFLGAAPSTQIRIFETAYFFIRISLLSTWIQLFPLSKPHLLKPLSRWIFFNLSGMRICVDGYPGLVKVSKISGFLWLRPLFPLNRKSERYFIFRVINISLVKNMLFGFWLNSARKCLYEFEDLSSCYPHMF